MENTIIPKSITGGDDLVVMSRGEYEKIMTKLDHNIALRGDINEAMEEVEEGKTKGPFGSAEELMDSLGA